MPKVTIKELQKALSDANKTIDAQMEEIARLNKELKATKHGKNTVSTEEFNGVLKELERVQEFKNIAVAQKDKEIANLKAQVKYLRSKLEDSRQKPGRKAFDDMETIEYIYKHYLEGDSLQVIADQLNSSGIKTRKGGSWGKSSVRVILLNHEYVERNIIPEETFNKITELLKSKRK